MSEEINNLFPKSKACIFQWNYPVVNLGRNELRNCCRTKANLLTSNDLENYRKDIILNSPIERENRARMLLGQEIEACSSCCNIEKKNVISPRKNMVFDTRVQVESLSALKHTLDSIPSFENRVQFLSEHNMTRSVQVNMLEITLTNTCDMQCMYCSHHYSSKWAAHRLKHNDIQQHQIESELPKPNQDFKKYFLEWFRNEGVHTVQYINFIGGEPTLINDFYEISDEIVHILTENNRTDVTLSVVTNLNCSPVIFNKFITHIRKIQKQLNFIDINVSIEAFGNRAEYIRYGLSWDRWTQNFETLIALKLEKVKISAQMATNILSITSLVDVIKYFWSLFEKYQVGIRLHENVVNFPQAHSPMLLTPDFSVYLDQAIQFLNEKGDAVEGVVGYDYGSWKSYALFLGTIKNAIEKHTLIPSEKLLVRDFFNQFNQRMNLDIYKIFPEYRSFLKSCDVEEK